MARGKLQVTPDEWGSNATLCLGFDGDADFSVSKSAISHGSVGAYPDMSVSEPADGLPLQVGSMRHPVTSWSTAAPSSGTYDVAYDLTYSISPSSTSWNGGAEVMIWLGSHGNPAPLGNTVASGVTVGGASYDVHAGSTAGGGQHVVVTFVRTSPVSAVSGLDPGAVSRAAARYGHFPASLYLTRVQAGFELWQGGTGLATTAFSFHG